MVDNDPTPPRERADKDSFDRDLLRDNGQPEGTRRADAPDVAHEQLEEGLGGYNFQKDRKGQAQSPVELNDNQPPRRKEGHNG